MGASATAEVDQSHVWRQQRGDARIELDGTVHIRKASEFDLRVPKFAIVSLHILLMLVAAEWG